MFATNSPTFPLHHPTSSSSSYSIAGETPLKLLCCNSLCPIPTSTSSYPSSSLSNIRRITTKHHFTPKVSFNPQGNFDIPILDDEDSDLQSKPQQPMPPKEGRFEVVIDNDAIQRLDLSPFRTATSISEPSSVECKEYLERTIGFTINYKREDTYDQRELSELPNIRLWFVRLDATYPWLPVLLDWRAGELARYAAMLVPHQMSARMGVVFNPEALELFIMKKVFTVYSWLKEQGFSATKARLKTNDMARMLGFGIGDDLFDFIDQHPISPPDG